MTSPLTRAANLLAACAALPAAAATTQLLPSGAVFWAGDSAYLSAADVPAGFFAGGAPAFLDTLEDGSLDGGLTTSDASVIIGPAFVGTRDSVDADDGRIDGSCGPQTSASGCGSLFNGNGGRLTVTFQGAGAPTAFGLVWTDGATAINVTVSATAADGSSLGSVTYGGIGDGSNAATTAEDRFFGVQFAGGVKSLTVVNSGGGIEVDHLQYGVMAAVPEPGTWALMAIGMLALGPLAGRRRGDA